MKRSFSKKESGAQGRKRRLLQEEETKTKKSREFFLNYFKKAAPSTSTSSSSTEIPPATVSEPDDKPSTSELNDQEEIKSVNSTCQGSEDQHSEQDMDLNKNEGDGCSDSSGNDGTETGEGNGANLSDSITPAVIEEHDIGLLEFDKGSGKPVVSDALRTEIVKLGSQYFQNSDGPFLPTNNRSMNKTWFKRKLGNGQGEEVTRSWLIYSPHKKSAFCMCCLLFSRSEHSSSLEQESGFSNWKKPERISQHENSKKHRDCFTQWKEMERNLVRNRGIDAGLQLQIEKEKQKWRDILKRILHCIKFLATQNLALRGHREHLQVDDSSNVGNFLGLVKLIAVFDPVMKEHLTRMETHPGSTSYLSPGVQNEFIHIIASTVRQCLLESIRKAKYYGLLFDSTPDQAHREQMSEVVRYVEVDFQSRKIHVKESFLGFIQISQKDAKSLAETIEKQLEKDKMDLKDCRSQCYDNAAVMAGHRSGVHQRISEKNELAVFVNCDNHSLNLVGVHAAKQDTMMVTFFGTIEAMYVFFSRSTQRWEKLKRALPVAVKSESETRWSARTEAVKPVCKYLAEILKVLENLIDNENETSDTRSDANELYNRMLTYDFLTLLGFWNTLLMRIDRVQKRLQDPAMNFHDAALDLKALHDNFSDEREDLVGEALKEGLDLCEEWNVAFERRRRRKKQMAGEQARDAGLTAKEEMERVMKGTLDRIHTEMGERFTRLNDTDAKFGFLLNVKELCYGTESTDLKKKCKNLGDVYTSDVNGQQLYQEILDCRMPLSSRPEVKISKPEQLLEFIVQYGDESVFPNLRIVVQIMLTVAVSIASCERSFSKLKLILSYLRASMGQDRLCDLALLSVEREETEKIDFEQIIDRFAAEKARKIRL
ncbi:zinc finger MYM-type protein 1-like [Diadema setosum]|uniref:zinc finger MYM-type protein 1-like n=1 Tax=Diadema setosum TaxID=31175 RepID=UPI003B3BD162